MSVALLFPGQGAQRPGMLRGIPDSPCAQAVLDESRQVCATLPLTGDLDDPGRDTVLTQLGLVIAGVACARSLLDDHGIDAGFVAGHSVGAFSAAVVAGVLTMHDALLAVHLRAESMRAACRDADWGMAAITGAPTRTVRDLVEEVGTSADPVWVANVNTGTQTVIGGTSSALERAAVAAREAGARSFERVAMAVASHGPVQDPTARALAARLAELDAGPPRMRYVTNTAGRAVSSAAAVLADLSESVARTVRWYDGVRVMSELGVTCTVEMTPGHTLTRLVAAAVPTMTARSLDDDGIRAVAHAALGR